MSQQTILITSCDRNYFDLCKGCIESIRDNPQIRNIPIGFFDVGCSRDQRDWLGDRVDFVREPRWAFDFPGRSAKPAHFRALLARPFLRDYFPGFEVYLWIDADAWVQKSDAIELLCKGALRRQGLAIVPEIDRCSLRQYGALPDAWRAMRNWYQTAFGDEIALQLYSYPMLNAGVFALHHDAPHWQPWSECVAKSLRNSCTILTDQLALNLIVYQRLFQQTELLPAWCNWTCHNGFPSWHEAEGCFVEPYLPHTPIGIMHLTHRQKRQQQRLMTTQQKIIQVRIGYPAEPIDASTEADEHRTT